MMRYHATAFSFFHNKKFFYVVLANEI
jgi:hypothetical protein